MTFDDVRLMAVAQLSACRRRIARCLSGYKRPVFVLGCETPIQTFYDGKLFDPLKARAGLSPVAGVPPYGLPASAEDFRWLARLDRHLTFTVEPQQSYFGDCIKVIHAPDERPLDPMFPPFGWS